MSSGSVSMCEYDVIVAGGGPAGVPAAVAAARNGARVLLIERWGFLGGMATAGMVVPMHTFHNMRGEQIVGGIPDEIVRRLAAVGGAFPQGHLWSAYQSSYTHTPFDVEAMKQVLLEIACEAGVEFLLHTFVLGARVSGKTLEGVKVANKSGCYELRSRVVVDATGDGDVAAAAGADFVKGGEHGECMAGSLMFRLGNVDANAVMQYVKEHPNEFVLAEDPFVGKTNAELAQMIHDIADIHMVRGCFEIVRRAQDAGEFPLSRNQVIFTFSPRRTEAYVNCTNVVHLDSSNAEQTSRAEIETRRQVPMVVAFFRKYIPGFADAYLIDTACQIGTRESRRIVGEYTLTGEDVLEGRRFPDGIARGAYPSDIHGPDGGLVHRHIRDGRDYHIPYRCLVPRDVDGLILAGRCISTDRIALGSIRVMAQCMATGQAAGTAAALAVRSGVAPRQLDHETLVNVLAEQGAIL